VRRHARHERLEVHGLEDLPPVAPHVLRCQHRAGALAHAGLRVLAVLQLPELGRRRQLPVVLVGDAGIGQRALKANGVRPRVLASADAPALAHVHQQPDARLVEGLEEAGDIPAVDADRGDSPHAPDPVSTAAEFGRSGMVVRLLDAADRLARVSRAGPAQPAVGGRAQGRGGGLPGGHVLRPLLAVERAPGRVGLRLVVARSGAGLDVAALPSGECARAALSPGGHRAGDRDPRRDVPRQALGLPRLGRSVERAHHR
jgi:hypothetical protein